MAEIPEPTEADARLGRAGELAAFLRDNSRAIRLDPEELGREFGVDPALVAQLQLGAANAGRRAGFDWGGFFKRSTTAVAKACDLLVSRPLVFLTVVSLAMVAAALFTGIRKSLLVELWVAAEACCLLGRPQLRNVAFASGLVWLVTSAGFYDEVRSDKGVQAQLAGGSFFLTLLMGMGMAIVNMMAGGLLLVVAGWIRIAAQRKKEAKRSRQDLLTRMFYLQERLATIPPKAPKRVHPIIEFARRNLFWTTVGAMFALGSLRDLATLAYHVDPSVLREAPNTVSKHGGGLITVSTPQIQGGYLLIESLLSLLRGLSVIALTLLATTRQKVRSVCLGLVMGQLLVMAWAWPLGGEGRVALALELAAVATVLLNTMILVMIVRFGVGFNRKLKQFRLGDDSDESSIMSELLQIRLRLSAVTVQVCVLVVDAAGSTQMKRGADPLLVEFSFGRYQSWIGETITSNGGKVDMRTGDGAICAFGDAGQAFKAAQELQAGIGEFNSQVNRLDSPFRLRVALHAGNVVAELDKVQFTEVIDVAAHVEKYSPVGGIALTEQFLAAARRLDQPLVLDSPATASVDGFDVFSVPAV